MSIFKFLKRCFRGDEHDSELLPLARMANPKPMPMSITSHLPISAKPIPHIDVSASSSTSAAMFEHEAIVSISSPHNSFTSNDTFEDVDLSTPTKFATPPKARKLGSSPFDDQHEVDSTLVISVSIKNGNHDNKVPNASYRSLNTLLVPAKQSTPVAGSDICTSPFDDKHEVESEIKVEYAPTTPSSVSDYAERAMEYQRGKLSSSSLLCEIYRRPC